MVITLPAITRIADQHPESLITMPESVITIDRNRP